MVNVFTSQIVLNIRRVNASKQSRRANLDCEQSLSSLNLFSAGAHYCLARKEREKIEATTCSFYR